MSSPKGHDYHYDSLSMDWRFCQGMLIVNALWDFLSAISIWNSSCVKDVQCLLASSTENASKPVDEDVEQAQPLLQCKTDTAAAAAATSLAVKAQKEDDATPPSTQEQEQNNNTNTNTNNKEAAWQSTVCLSIAGMHTHMWSRKTDALNYAACMLMAWWVLTLGFIRLYAAMEARLVILAAFSYAIEGLFFLAEAFKSTMDPKKASFTSIFSFVCMLLCVIQIQ